MTTDYKTLLQQKAALDARIAEALKHERTAVIAQIREIVEQYKLTGQDIFPVSKNKALTRPVGQPKYRDPATGATWTGRGKPPGWIIGKDRTKLAV